MLFSFWISSLSLSGFVAAQGGHDHGHAQEHLLKRDNVPVTQCFSDDCYRHLLHIPTLAAALCTYTGTATTTITPYTIVTHAPGEEIIMKENKKQQNAKREPAAFRLQGLPIPSSCAVALGTLLTSRVSSACSCLSSETTTFTSIVYAATATAIEFAVPAYVSQDGAKISPVNGKTMTLQCSSAPIYGDGDLVIPTTTIGFRLCAYYCYMYSDCKQAFWMLSGSYEICALLNSNSLNIQDHADAIIGLPTNTQNNQDILYLEDNFLIPRVYI